MHGYWEHPEGGFEEGEVSPTPPRRQNPHMHVFEALLSFYETTGEALHLARAGALARLFEEKLFDRQRGVLPEYFDDQWRPLSDEYGCIVEPGHHFEWSWLLRRWRALGGGDLNAEAEKLRQFAEKHGVDASGAVYDEVHADGRPRRATSRLWPHTERLKANLACYEASGDAAAANAGAQAFDMLLGYLDTPTKGLWYDVRKPDASFVQEPAKASSFYHIAVAIGELTRVSAIGG
jgi:mannose-6-phosphate isomerase